MRAAVYSGDWDLKILERGQPRRQSETDVLLRVRATGVCGTDIGILSGAYGSANLGIVLGHEFSAEVSEVSPYSRFAVGDRVTVDPTYHCGVCRSCRRDRPNHCELKFKTETGVTKDGAFCAYHVCDERFLYPLTPNVTFAAAALAEPLSCVLTGVEKLALRASYDVAVVGAGPIGLLYAWALSLKGVAGTIVERSSARRIVAQSLLPKGWVVAEDISERDRPGSQSKFDTAVDTTAGAISDLIERMHPGGQLLQVGLRKNPISIDVGLLADKSLSIIGSIDSHYGSFQAAVALIQNGVVPADALVTHQIALEELPEALKLLGCDLEARRLVQPQDALKVVVSDFR